jgi:acetyltransferase-like isoleucine patch superfamily enzyme
MNGVKTVEFFLERLIRIRARLYTLVLFSSFRGFGKGSVITPPLRFHNLRHIQVGNKVIINSNCWLQVVTDRPADNMPLLILQNEVSIGMNATISAAKKIIIEDHVMLGRNVFITDHGHEYKDISVPIDSQGIGKSAEVRIGAQTWIGQNAVILPGATIGKHCVIGANSVVNSPVPDFCVAAGAPAKIIRRYDGADRLWKRAGMHE